ncbi:hypothetical protein SODALDRAFT_400834 [Sodiomyces alkalinus F11]|uniref:Uncharacterized protein n=1 Tax=Sodiomyces alkalinus (strain CBS 110278 / VKM F-3762 / F11) TaxID=1314773 RepID=A0A3N2PRL3_SODAK|nr:hypothetical protein SODALDRAFT_400834 [Sodiomyces alkalinus F11]ROT37135.1 hypothetical protein SODALDRAFT_400834 [Sodiomyces alkalinus F11]
MYPHYDVDVQDDDRGETNTSVETNNVETTETTNGVNGVEDENHFDNHIIENDTIENDTIQNDNIESDNIDDNNIDNDDIDDNIENVNTVRHANTPVSLGLSLDDSRLSLDNTRYFEWVADYIRDLYAWAHDAYRISTQTHRISTSLIETAQQGLLYEHSGALAQSQRNRVCAEHILRDLLESLRLDALAGTL